MRSSTGYRRSGVAFLQEESLAVLDRSTVACACCVFQPGRTFLRRMINMSTITKKLHTRNWLNGGFKSDLYWWACFLPKWNGVSMMTGVLRGPVYETITSWGCRAYTCSGQLKWPKDGISTTLHSKTYFQLFLAVAMWGREWQGRSFQCWWDQGGIKTSMQCICLEVCTSS